MLRKNSLFSLAKVCFAFILFSGCGKSPFLKDNNGKEKNTFSNSSTIQELTSNDYQLQISSFWQAGPRIGNESKLLIVVLDKKKRPTEENFKLKIKLWMPNMGHGSFPVTVVKKAASIFEASELFFTMPGLWDIHFQFYSQEDELMTEIVWPLIL